MEKVGESSLWVREEEEEEEEAEGKEGFSNILREIKSWLWIQVLTSNSSVDGWENTCKESWRMIFYLVGLLVLAGPGN